MPINSDGLYCTKHAIIVSDSNEAKKFFYYNLEDGLMMKVFYKLREQYKNLDEVTKINNICWINGIAPRVYKLIKVGYLNQFQVFRAQIVEYISEPAINHLKRYD